jgi:hypothetical protein
MFRFYVYLFNTHGGGVTIIVLLMIHKKIIIAI